MQTFELLKNALKAFKVSPMVKQIVIIYEPDDQKRDRIEQRLEEKGFKIEHVCCTTIYVRMKK